MSVYIMLKPKLKYLGDTSLLSIEMLREAYMMVAITLNIDNQEKQWEMYLNSKLEIWFY